MEPQTGKKSCKNCLKKHVIKTRDGDSTESKASQVDDTKQTIDLFETLLIRNQIKKSQQISYSTNASHGCLLKENKSSTEILEDQGKSTKDLSENQTVSFIKQSQNLPKESKEKAKNTGIGSELGTNFNNPSIRESDSSGQNSKINIF